MDDLSKIQLQWVVMQVTDHLPFNPMLFGWSLAWSLVYSFNVLVHQVRGSWKSQTAFSNRPEKRLVACYTFYIRKSRLLDQLNVALNFVNVHVIVFGFFFLSFYVFSFLFLICYLMPK